MIIRSSVRKWTCFCFIFDFVRVSAVSWREFSNNDNERQNVDIIAERFDQKKTMLDQAARRWQC